MTKFAAWMTYREVSRLFLCSEKTIANRVGRHRLRHALVPQGKAHRRVAVVPPETVRALGVLLKTPLTELLPEQEEPVVRGSEAARVAGGLDEDEV